MLIFVLQTIWLYIGELAGRDLDLQTLGKFFVYAIPTLLPLVLPLTVLLVSIMVFGNFAENYEFAAMKSTGISLQRAMRSLSIFIALLAITVFFFANNVIPWANYNWYNLRNNIKKVKPAMAIVEGQFNDFENFNIKVEEKSGDHDQYLKNVVIHQKKANKSGNYTVIVSKTGELMSSESSNVLQLVLNDGNYYDEVYSKDPKERLRKPHAKSYFEKYTINIDLAGMDNVDIDEKKLTDRYNMLNINGLNRAIDTIKTQRVKGYETLSEVLYNRSAIANLKKNITQKKDSTCTDSIYKGDILDIFEKASTKVQLLTLSLNTTTSTQSILTNKEKTFVKHNRDLNNHTIALHEKYVLGFACIILFFVGAPLGALIRKGGIGLPIVIAILLFLTYHFIGIFAKNSAKGGTLDPILATWLSTLIMLPLSIYLTNRATKDRALFEFGSLTEPLKKLFKIGKESIISGDLLPIKDEDYNMLTTYDDAKLIDILKNYRQYDFNENYKVTTLEILNSRGITEQELRFGGNLKNQLYEDALRYKLAFNGYSKMALTFYILNLAFNIVGAVLKNNGFPILGTALIVVSVLAAIIYFYAFIKSFINQSNFYKVLNKRSVANALIFVLVGIPLYFIYFFIYNKKMEEDLKQIR